MEKDFLGLSSRKTSMMAVKEEITDGCDATARISAMQWPFSNKASGSSQLLSFKTSQDDGLQKTGFESLPAAGFTMVSSSEGFDSNHKPYSSFAQKTLSPDKQGGIHYTVMTYHPTQHFDGHSVPRAREIKILPKASQTNQKISVSLGTPPHQPFLASSGHTVIASSVVGTTELRNASKPSGGLAQLTIFYAGRVCVYDDISPEKAQAIMLLAGNGHSTAHKVPSMTQVEATPPKSSHFDASVGNQLLNILPLGLASPVSITSHTGTTDVTAVRSNQTLHLSSPPIKPEPSKVGSSLGPISASLIPTVAVPQARKASLARFLEKRKERVLSSFPYLSKQSSECKTTPVSEGRSLSTNSASSPLPGNR